MTKLSWDASGERLFQTGVDRGVLYPKTGPGVSWNGLIGVTESPTGGEAKPYYIDGIKYHNESSSEEFEATIEAFTYPDEFSELDGTGGSSDSGLYYGQQTRDSFGLAYRTKIGNDVAGVDYGFKYHLIYNALASPTEVSNKTMANDPEAHVFSWGITTRPEIISARKPTSHVIIDSTTADPAALSELTSLLHGTDTVAPRLPSLYEVVTLFDDWGALQIKTDAPTGLASLIYRSDYADLKGDVKLGLYTAPSQTRLRETSTAGLYTLE